MKADQKGMAATLRAAVAQIKIHGGSFNPTSLVGYRHAIDDVLLVAATLDNVIGEPEECEECRSEQPGRALGFLCELPPGHEGNHAAFVHSVFQRIEWPGGRRTE